MNMKVWSNRREPVRLFETGLNTITTNFCTDERHRKCLALGICQAQEPRCEWDKCKMAGMSTHRYFNIATEGGGLGATIKISKERDAKVAAALAKFLNQCKPYVLTWEMLKTKEAKPVYLTTYGGGCRKVQTVDGRLDEHPYKLADARRCTMKGRHPHGGRTTRKLGGNPPPRKKRCRPQKK